MNKLDFSELNRFLVSVGSIFYGFAIAIPWLFFKEGLSFKITDQGFNLLTDKSKSIVIEKQEYLNTLVKIIPWLSLLLLILGSIAIVIGINR